MKETRNNLVQFRVFDWEKKLIMKLANGKSSNVRDLLVKEAKTIFDSGNKFAVLNKEVRELDEKIFFSKETLDSLKAKRKIAVGMIEEKIKEMK